MKCCNQPMRKKLHSENTNPIGEVTHFIYIILCDKCGKNKFISKRNK